MGRLGTYACCAMILTFISPSGERWSFDVTSDAGQRAAAEWLADRPEAQAAWARLMDRQVPKGKALLAHVASGWQCIASNP